MPSTRPRSMEKCARCVGVARDADLKGLADLCGEAANPGQDAAAVRTAVAMRWRGLEPPRGINPTRPSTLRVYQFRHQRARPIVATPCSDADDELALRVTLAHVSQSIGSALQLVAALDDRLHGPRLEQLAQHVQVGPAGLCDEEDGVATARPRREPRLGDVTQR